MESSGAKCGGKVLKTASYVYDIFPTQRNDVPAHNLFHNAESKWYPFLIEYGRIGMVKSWKKGKKLEEQGKTMIMVGYALHHKPGSYRMYNPETGKIIICDNIS